MIEPRTIIRRAEANELDALVELAGRTFRETYRPFDDPADIEEYIGRALTPAALDAVLHDEASTVLFAMLDDHPIGYAHIRCSPAPAFVAGDSPVEVVRFYLRSDAVGRGLGTELMHAVRREARRAGADALWLAVYERNERARAFYRKRGFTDVGTRDFFYGGRTWADPVMAVRLETDE